MKTLAVLSALVAMAIAAPAVENYADSTRLLPGDFVITQRDKKSTPPETQDLPKHLGSPTSEQALNKPGPINSDARTFSGFKKPIVVQKKIGYQVYRDSDGKQSQVDSQEKCRTQMKTTLCEDSDSEDKVKSASFKQHRDGLSEKELVHNIHIAKEAVHTFERDLERMEHECAENNNSELHHDIEKAREALEDIHRKFRNFDSVATTIDGSTLKAHSSAVKTDGERRTQWKEAQNVHNDIEVGNNLQDRFKNTDDKDNFNKDSQTFIEDVDVPLRTHSGIEDGMTSIIEDKNQNLKIHSDSLIKSRPPNEDTQQKQENLPRMDNKADLNNHEIRNHLEAQEPKEPATEGIINHRENTETLKSSNDHSSSNIHERGELEKGHLHEHSLKENDQAMDGTNNVENMLRDNNKINTLTEEGAVTNEGITMQKDKNQGHLHHDNLEHRSKHTELTNTNREPLKSNTDKNFQHMDVQRSTQMEMSSKTHDFKSKNEMNVDSETSLSTMTTSKLDNEKVGDHMDSHVNNDLALLRATSDFHKELLNNMDFVDDSHHTALHQTSLTDKNQMMKNEKQVLHERLNVPKVYPNVEHLKAMMHFSDNSHHATPQLKMASMFNNEEPNLNVQFNSPQEFVEQTNFQELMPFRAHEHLNDKTELDSRFQSMHDIEAMPSLHDPLTVHRAHPDNMKMDGSSQHFNIEQLNHNDHHHLSQQKWSNGFDHLHSHDSLVSRNNGHNVMMHEKSNMNGISPSAFMQMRGTPKMALERNGPHQWASTHGAFRSSYGPGAPPSYGSQGGSSYGESAVGLFPNAKVGNCAVPILLSCSPSVVSGSLAKAPNSYSAPAYRSEDINFLKKRGINIDEGTRDLQLRNTRLDQRPTVFLQNNNVTV